MPLDPMDALTTGIATKADKMRVLDRHGYSRADIARFLGVRYQQVRNTLEGDKRTGYNPMLGTAALEVTDTAFEPIGVSSEGSITIPPHLVSDIGDSSPWYAIKVEDGVFLTTLVAAMNRAARSLA